jgi:hypothetical protein
MLNTLPLWRPRSKLTDQGRKDIQMKEGKVFHLIAIINEALQKACELVWT